MIFKNLITLRPLLGRQPSPVAHTCKCGTQVNTYFGALRKRNLAKASAHSSTGYSVILEPQSAQEALELCDTLVLDCDGVLWRGSELIMNAVEAIKLFRKRGKRLLFVTNNSSKSRMQYVSKFDSLGFDVAAHEIVSSSYAVAAYLKSQEFAKKVFLLGQHGTEQELQQLGIDYIGGEDFQMPLLPDAGSMKTLHVDPSIGAVVVAWDPAFSYSKLVYASICLRELPGCILVVSNTDSGDNIGDGRVMPGTGAIAAAVKIASGAAPIVVGKGGPWLLPFLCQQYDLDPARAGIIGDRLDTDIALGKQGGMRTFLPLTGVATMEDVAKADPSEVPDFIMPSIATLAGLPSI